MTVDRWHHFRENLLGWYRPERRPMPWKEHNDPYNIWLSEIILQQTRVEQGTAYYERFAATYPTVRDLARAPDDEVMKLWEGLGYYSRARNLLKAARMVVDQYDGDFPDTYVGLLKLPGVGPYTAAAIASFAFDRQVAVLDGNVYRVLSRYAGVATPTDSTAGKHQFSELATLALGEAPAARFNQAIMDFGALVCTPRKAACKVCPLAKACVALAENRVYDLPVKEKKLKRRDRHFHYLVIKDDSERTIIQQRSEKDIWQDLYQFPLLETPKKTLASADLPLHPDWPAWLPAGELTFRKRSQPFKQQLTHQTIYATFHTFHWKLMPGSGEGFVVTQNKLLDNFAFPRVIAKFIEDKRLLLDLF
ncbi:A/G-specific adenine glycosylase [Neolewinella antarctica]|uniref:Adenine DNA glycosylase n=1 Tax=Neolewinella antarctica TaxID=442734 RepID=A0ABX0XG98_9BACT|nr:A/G-specific adenine glycosylase [Neolewinella antarctica]NJC27899.1 A/G-specific adenine glycosylase [Neolewinella antarctica]